MVWFLETLCKVNPISFIRRESAFRYRRGTIKSMHGGAIGFTKKRAGLPRLAIRTHPVGTSQGRAGAQDAGISTVSTTWITPLD